MFEELYPETRFNAWCVGERISSLSVNYGFAKNRKQIVSADSGCLGSSLN